MSGTSPGAKSESGPADQSAGRAWIGAALAAARPRQSIDDRTGKWGETGDSDWVSGPGDWGVDKVIDRVSKADPKDIQEVAASQLALVTRYHKMVLNHSDRGFFWALIGGGVGLLFFMLAVGVVLLKGDAPTAVIAVIAGAVVEVVAGIMFFLYGKATTQLSDFHGSLEVLRRYLLANSLCENLEGDTRNEARAELIREIVRPTPEKSRMT